MFKKATSPEIIKNYVNLLNALIGAFDTNMTTDEITSFIKYQIQASPKWKFEQFVLKGDNDLRVSPELGSEVSVVILYDSYISIAHDKIQAQIQDGLMTEAPIEEEGSDIYYGG